MTNKILKIDWIRANASQRRLDSETKLSIESDNDIVLVTQPQEHSRRAVNRKRKRYVSYQDLNFIKMMMPKIIKNS